MARICGVPVMTHAKYQQFTEPREEKPQWVREYERWLNEQEPKQPELEEVE